MGAVVGKERCPRCAENGHDRSGDNLIRYADGGATCYRGGCGYYETKTKQGNIRAVSSPTRARPLVEGGDIQSLPHRCISERICAKYNYQVRPHNGDNWEIASYYDSEKVLVAQKLRNPNTKQFSVTGDLSKAGLYGSQLARAGGPIIVITEGEIDAMSVCEAFEGKYPALSIPSGAAGAKKAFQQNIDLLNTYDKVVIFFDNDEPGREAAKEAADVLAPGKAYFASMSDYKDANEALVDGKKTEIVQAVWGAREHRPDGIVHVKDVSLVSETKDIPVFDFPFDCMTKASYGLMGGEVVVMASGSGMGKSTVVREMIYNNLNEGCTVGALMLEEDPTKTKQDIASIHIEQPIHLALTARTVNAQREASGREPIDFGHIEEVSPEALSKAEAYLASTDLYLYDHWGALDIDVLLKRLNYMVYACGCNIIYIDHLSIIVSGIEGNDERRDLDRLMAELKAFAQRTKAAIVAVCHLKKSNSTPHEEGGQVSLSDFRGSGALYQYADKCFGFERDQQSTGDDTNLMKIRMLKNRFAGTTGIIGAAKFSHTRHRLIEQEYTEPTPFTDES